MPIIPQEPNQFSLPALPETYGNMEMSAPLSVPPQLAQSFGHDPYADLNLSYPAQEAFSKYVTEQPNRDQYQPSKLRRILAGAGGFSAGWQQGPQAGIGLAQGIIDTPYHQALENWKLGLAPRQHAAQIEATMSGQQFTNAYRQARLQQDANKQKSAAYTGTWKDTTYYNSKTNKIRTVQKNTKTGEYRDSSTMEPVAGPGPDEEERQRSFGTFNQVSNQEGVPTLTMSGVDKQRMLAKDPNAFTNTNVPVAEPLEIGVNEQGVQVGATGKNTAVARPITVATPPGQIPPPPMRKVAMSTGEIDRRNQIKELDMDYNTLKANLADALKTTIGPGKSALARAKASNWNFLSEVWDPAKPSVVQSNFLTAENSIRDTLARIKSGAAIPAWEYTALEKIAPNSKQPPQVFMANFERFGKVLDLMKSNRAMNNPAQFETEVGRIMTPPMTPQTKLKWARTPQGKVFVEDPTTGIRPAREGEILDPTLEHKKGK